MKRFLAIGMALMLALCACSSASQSGGSVPAPAQSTPGSPDSRSPAADPGKPDTWIADRHIKGRLFMEDIGTALPDDQTGNSVARKIKELTGITLEWEYTTGNTDLEVLITALAAGDIPDLIVCYLDDSSRPEWTVLRKAALEGMFADIRPYLEQAKVYSKYLDPEWLPYDSYHNITCREEFGGASYFLQMQVAREPDSTRRNGIQLYANTEYTDAAGVKLEDIRTSEDLLEAARKIKAADLKDTNGQSVIPVGPTCWNGRLETWYYRSKTLSSGRDAVFYLDNGTVTHISKSPLLLDQIELVQTALREGLYDPEIFTMEGGRARENFQSKRYAFQVMSNWQATDKILSTGAQWRPVTYLEDAAGSRDLPVQKKSPWMNWAVSSKADNPGEIVAFADFMAGREGKLLWMYGIEGEHYDLNDQGFPIVKQELVDVSNNDFSAAMQYNIMALEGMWGRPLGYTDLAQYEDFGEYSFLENLDPEREAIASNLFEYGDPVITYYDGTPASAFIDQMPEDLQTTLKQFIEPQYHADIFVQACFAGDMNEAGKLVNDYRALMEKQGVSEFEQYLQSVYDTTPEAVHFN